jgi:hypothetical protein
MGKLTSLNACRCALCVAERNGVKLRERRCANCGSPTDRVGLLWWWGWESEVCERCVDREIEILEDSSG